MRRLLRAVLEPQGYQVLEADSGSAGMARAVETRPDVIILELALADTDGLDLLGRLREWSPTPVLVLSERGDDESKVAALDAGADDYLTKPFSASELLARLRVLLRPLAHTPDGPLIVEGDLVVNLATHTIRVHGRPVELTPKEEALFFVLARYAGKIVTRAHLLTSVWGAQAQDKVHDLAVLIGHLRKKLGTHRERLEIRTEGHLGYSLVLNGGRQRASARRVGHAGRDSLQAAKTEEAT